MTRVVGFEARSAPSDELPTLVKQLKAALGSGGTIDDSSADGPAIELQGDHRDRLVEYFRSLGYPAKPAGA